jgi:hypothetical protein
VGEAVVGGVEIGAALVQAHLVALVVRHRRQAGGRGQVERQQLELDRDVHGLLVGLDGDLAPVSAGRPITGIDLEPQRLVVAGGHRQREAAAAGAGVLRHQLHRLPAGGIGGGVSAVRLVDVIGPGGLGDVHVVDGEHGDVPAAKIRSVIARRRVPQRRAVVRGGERGERGAQLPDAGLARPHDQLERHDLVPGGEQLHRAAVPQFRGGGRVARIPLQRVAVADGPDHRYRRRGQRGRGRLPPAGGRQQQHDGEDRALHAVAKWNRRPAVPPRIFA